MWAQDKGTGTAKGRVMEGKWEGREREGGIEREVGLEQQKA